MWRLASDKFQQVRSVESPNQQQKAQDYEGTPPTKQQQQQKGLLHLFGFHKDQRPAIIFHSSTLAPSFPGI